MDNLKTYIANILLNGLEDFNITEKKRATVVTNTIRRSILEKLESNKPFYMDESIKTGDKVALNFFKSFYKYNKELSNYEIKDFIITDISNSKNKISVTLYNKYTDKNFIIDNVYISNIKEMLTAPMGLHIIPEKLTFKPLNRDDKITDLDSVFMKYFNIKLFSKVEDLIANETNDPLIISTDNKSVIITDPIITISDLPFIIYDNNKIYSGKSIRITGLLNAVDRFCIWVAGCVKEHKELKDVSFILLKDKKDDEWQTKN